MITGIYKITNKLNNKVYIGQSIDIEKRWEAHKFYSYNEKTALQLAFKKYGVSNFNFEIIEKCDKEKLNEREQYWIKFYNSYGENGYNMNFGGENKNSLDYDLILHCYLEEQSIHKTSERLNIHRDSVRKVLNLFNISYNKEQGEPKKIIMIDPYSLKELKIFNSLKEASDYVKISDATIRKHLSGKLSTAGGYYWKELGVEKTFEPLTNQQRKTTKPLQIEQYDLNGEFLQLFKSLSQANQSVNKHRSNTQIKEVCEGKKQEAFGYKWKYRKE